MSSTENGPAEGQCFTANMQWKPDPDLYHPYLRKRVLRGRGIGKGLQYTHWLGIRDVPSRGTSSSVKGIRVQRPYHLLSELETTYFFLLERQCSVVDIREQWPILDIDRTLELCAQQGIRHKFCGPNPEPCTIDFVITEEIDGMLRHRAASIKSPKDAADSEIRKRLYVEHTWCQEQGIPWTLVDTSTFDKKLLDVLRFMRGWFRNRFEPEPLAVARFSSEFLQAHSSKRRALKWAVEKSLAEGLSLAPTMIRTLAGVHAVVSIVSVTEVINEVVEELSTKRR